MVAMVAAQTPTPVASGRFAATHRVNDATLVARPCSSQPLPDHGFGDANVSMSAMVVAVGLDVRPGGVPQPGTGELREPRVDQLGPVGGGPSDAMPASIAGAGLFLIVLRSTPGWPRPRAPRSRIPVGHDFGHIRHVETFSPSLAPRPRLW